MPCKGIDLKEAREGTQQTGKEIRQRVEARARAKAWKHHQEVVLAEQQALERVSVGSRGTAGRRETMFI